MKKAPKIRYNGNIALIHTREDIDVLMKAHNQMADIVNELIDIVEKQEEMIKKMESENGTGITEEEKQFAYALIDAQLTAYDPDKVVEQLKDHAIEFEAFGQCSNYVELSHAIGIVKGGGR